MYMELEHRIGKDGWSLQYDVKWECGETVISKIKKYGSDLNVIHPSKSCHSLLDGYCNSTEDLCYQKRNPVTSSSMDLY